ncbi:hypothetical protein niasHS_011246 [Heterodera schachtii]|uniref:Uncharacterized protein n=1 Tax=Heterodera schachtii TaxID=97005 RepID=A0ABD2ITX8_HETSC
MPICPHISLLPFLVVFSAAALWTEKDEAKRIAQIKSEEQRVYEEQMGQKLPSLSSGTSAEGIATDEFPPPPSPPHSHGFPRHFPSLSPAVSSVDHFSSNLSVRHFVANAFWCFHCASPWNAISEPMQRVVKNLLEIRRAHFPTAQIVRRDCVEPRELDELPRQICRGFSHCQTLILTDHGSGSAFTMRGCAERFGAVDVEVLARRGDNVCKRLHEKVDIQECICERRKYCHAGSDRSSSVRFTPMSEWHRRQAVPSSAASSGQLQKSVGPSAEALQRSKSNGERGTKKQTMLIRLIGMTTMINAMIRTIIGTGIGHSGAISTH